MEPIRRRRLELKRLWNSSLPIHKLSDEHLIRILSHIPYIPQRRRNQYTNGQPAWLDLGWPSLMPVCRYWRDLLISTPIFWRQVNLWRQPSWTKLCLSRSAPGSIDVRVGEGADPSRLDDIRSHVHRCKTFHYNNRFNDDAPLIAALTPLFKGGMPLLQGLHFTVGTDARESTASIDACITSERFASLRVLTLASAIIAAPQDPCVYAQLRHLTLLDCPPALSLSGFLDALTASVQLEELSLRGVLHRLLGDGDPQVPHRPLVSLPCLRSLRLDEYRMDPLSSFLSHLNVQPSAVHWIRGRYEAPLRGREAKTIRTMLPLNRPTALPALTLATNVHMTIWADKYTISCGRAGPLIYNSVGDSPQVLLILKSSRFGNWNRSMVKGLDDLVEAFGSSPLTRLAIDGDQTHSTADAWERVFRAFPLLEELDLNDYRSNLFGSDVCNVFRGLHAASTAHADSESVTVACPNLRHIHVNGLAKVATYEAMRECLRYRGDRGVVLDSLDMKSLADWCDDGVHSDDDTFESPSGPRFRRGFIQDVSNVVKFINTEETFSEQEAEQQTEERDLDSDSDI